MLMHLHYEEILPHQLDEKQLMTWDLLHDIPQLILQLHQIPTNTTVISSEDERDTY